MAYMLEWQRSTLKSGKPGNRWLQVVVYYTPINYCDLCEKFGTPRKVSTRNDVFGWNFTSRKDYTTKSKDMLCMGCWNKIRSLRKREREADELRTFINRLQRIISNERKQNNQDHGRTAGLSGDDDGGREERRFGLGQGAEHHQVGRPDQRELLRRGEGSEGEGRGRSHHARAGSNACG